MLLILDVDGFKHYVMKSSVIALHQDENSEEDWYLGVLGENGFQISESTKNFILRELNTPTVEGPTA